MAEPPCQDGRPGGQGSWDATPGSYGSLCDDRITERALHRITRRSLLAAAACAAVVAGLALALWLFTDAQVARRTIEAIEDQGTEERPVEGQPVDFLVVGSDDRSGLTAEERSELSTGRPTGSVRTDVLLIVQLRPATGEAAMVSLPRDLLVSHRGSEVKVNSVLAREGRDGLVVAIEDLTGIELDHYVEVSMPAFLTAVEAVGGVEVCLEEPLVDDDAGADLPAGCQELDAAGSLSFVRSRQGPRGDFERIERQQRFLRSLIDEVTSARTALDVPRLFRVANRMASSLTTDETLSLNDLRTLAEELRGLASGDVRAATVPAYASEGGLVPYDPGSRRLFEALKAAEDLPDTGTPEERSAARVHLWHDGAPGFAGQVESVLFFAGFEVEVVGNGPVDPIGVEVFAGDDEVARWVANLLGVDARALPTAGDAGNADALVGVGG